MFNKKLLSGCLSCSGIIELFTKLPSESNYGTKLIFEEEAVNWSEEQELVTEKKLISKTYSPQSELERSRRVNWCDLPRSCDQER